MWTYLNMKTTFPSRVLNVQDIPLFHPSSLPKLYEALVIRPIIYLTDVIISLIFSALKKSSS
jgi:hypothetical protein